MALVRDNCLAPTIDDSALGYIKESSSEQFVPDVFYKVYIKYFSFYCGNFIFFRISNSLNDNFFYDFLKKSPRKSYLSFCQSKQTWLLRDFVFTFLFFVYMFYESKNESD